MMSDKVLPILDLMWRHAAVDADFFVAKATNF
jgi:hypothetical protein